MWRPLSFSEKKFFIAPPPNIQYLSFGYQFVLADSLWLRAIQDFDFCEKYIRDKHCSGNSWLYQMLDSITTLAPDHLPAYVDGGVNLSVILSDVDGASKIYKKGTRVFPENAQLLFRAAVHAYSEEKNKAKAAELFRKSAQAEGVNGTWLYALATRLYTETGQREVAEKLYYQMKEQGLEEVYLERMREKLGIKDD